MLRDKKKTLEIVKAIHKNISTPFSLKVRIWLNDDDIENQFKFLLEASPYVYMISVHGRLYKQWHSWDVNRDFIYRLKKELPDTIIIGNGWLRTYDDCVEKLQNLDGMMPAQSAIGNPWILTPHDPTPLERYETIIAHLDMAMACEIYFKTTIQAYDHQYWLIQPTLTQLQDIANILESIDPELLASYHTPVEFRKYLFNYISWLPDNKSLKKKIPPARDYQSLKILLREYFESWVMTWVMNSDLV